MAHKKTSMMRINQTDVTIKIAKYVRVSTDRQAEEGYSIEVQKERLDAYVRSMFGSGDVDQTFYLDDGFSGAYLDRPAMQRLIGDVKDGMITHVIVYKLDRLSRSQKDTLYLIEDIFLPHNVAFVSMQESFNTATPFGRAVVGILSVFAQLERENIFERTRSGMQKRVESGLWPGGGRVPFGYDYDTSEGILKPNRDADTVRKIYRLYLDGYSLQKIADVLHLKYERLAYQILTRKSNTGCILYNDVEYVGKHEPIISLDMYEQAMAMMHDRSVKRLVSATEHLLTGLVYCGVCGAKMRYQKWGNAGFKFVCYSHQKSKKYLIKDPNCDNENPWADEIEYAVVEDLFHMTKHELDGDKAQSEPIKMMDILQDQHDMTAKKLKRLYNLYAESENGILLETIADAKSELQTISAKIEAEEERGFWSKKIQKTKEKVSNIQDVWEYMSTQERRNIISSVTNQITVTHDLVNIEYKF